MKSPVINCVLLCLIVCGLYIAAPYVAFYGQLLFHDAASAETEKLNATSNELSAAEYQKRHAAIWGK